MVVNSRGKNDPFFVAERDSMERRRKVRMFLDNSRGDSGLCKNMANRLSLRAFFNGELHIDDWLQKGHKIEVRFEEGDKRPDPSSIAGS